MELVFRKKKPSEWLVLFMLFMPFAFSLLCDFLSLPRMLRYTVDLAWVLLTLGMLLSKRISFERRTISLLLIAGAFFLVGTVSFAVNYESIFLYLWGMRNNIRFFIFFFACIFYINPKSKENYLKALDVIYWINFPIVLIQYFGYGYNQDYLGGFFGVTKGCNASMNIFLVVIVAKSLLYFFGKKESAAKCLAKCAIALTISALSELKIFYIEFILILVLTAKMTRFSMKKIWIGIAAVIGIFVSLKVLGYLFPVFDDWFRMDKIIRTLTNTKGYTSTNDMNRLTVIPMAMDGLLPDTVDKLFGLGLGNCDYGEYAFLTSNFARKYRALNYMLFSTAYLLLETGFVGMALYLLFFIAAFFSIHKIQKTLPQTDMHCQLAKIVIIMIIPILIYNNSMRTESAFMMFFIMALPFIRQKNPVAKRRSMVSGR